MGLRSSLPAGVLPTSIAIGDFNGDGRMDWAVASGGDNTVDVYLGNGDGTAKPPVIIPLSGISPTAIAAGDLNGDGKIDLVVTEADTHTVGILLGNGDGTFQPEIELPPFPVATLAVAISDLRKSGHADLVVGVAGNVQTAATGRFAVLLNDGTGHFGAPIYAPNVPESNLPSALELSVMDVNGDGFPDVLATGNDNDGLTAQIFLGVGDGTFTSGQVLEISQQGNVPRIVQNAALADVNGDGCPDAIVVDSNSLAAIFRGDCKGDFNTSSGALVYGMGDNAYGLAVTDINGDGHPDLIIGGVPQSQNVTPFAGDTTGNMVGVRLNDGAGHFGPLRMYRGDPGIFSLAVADLSGNGHPDIITANQDANTSTVYPNDGTASFDEPSGGYDGEYEGNVNGFFNPPESGFLITDIDGDGLPDIGLIEANDATTNQFQITVMLNQGGGKFSLPVRTPALPSTFTVGDFVFADFRKTGHKDFLGVVFDDSSACAPPQLIYAKYSVNGKFGTPTMIPFPVADPCFPFPVLAVGDFNGDGKLDFAVITLVSSGSASNQLSVYLGNGDGTFRTPSQMEFNNAGGDENALFAGDANGDGKADLFLWVNVNVIEPAGKDVFELISNGDGTFKPPVDVVQSLSRMTMRDLNHDGRLDIVDIESGEGVESNPGSAPAQVSIYLGQADGSFSLANQYSPFPSFFSTFFGNSADSGPNGLIFAPYIGDFNGDGNLDLAIFQRTGSDIGLSYAQFLAGNGDGTFTPAYNVYPLLIGRIPDQVGDNLFGDGHSTWIYDTNFAASFVLIPGTVAQPFQIELVEVPALQGQDILRISLNAPSSSSTAFAFSASNPGVEIPAGATIPAGTLSLDVPITLASGFTSDHWFSITAQADGTSATTYGYLAPSNEVIPFTLDISGGFAAQGTQSSAAPGQDSLWSASISSMGDSSSIFQIVCKGLPASAVCDTSLPAEIDVPPASSVVAGFNISTETTIAPGSYPFTVEATDGITTLSSPQTLEVGDFSLIVTPGSVTVQPVGTAAYSMNFVELFGYTQNVIVHCSGLPADAVCQQEGESILPFGTEPLNVMLNGTPEGTYSFTVTTTSNSLVHSQTAQLQVVKAPTVTLDTSSFYFGGVLIGATGSATIHLKNTGTGTLNLTGLTATETSGASAMFGATSSCPANLSAGAACQITLSFSPSAVGLASGTLTLTDNAVDSPQTLPLSGLGVDFKIEAASGGSTSAMVSPGQTATYSLQILATDFEGEISLSCTGQPEEAACNPPSSVDIQPNTSGAFTVTVTTTAPSTAAIVNRDLDMKGRVLTFVFSILGLIVLLVRSRSSAPQSAMRLICVRGGMVIALVTAIVVLESCGGGGSGGGGGSFSNPGTSRGTYTLTLSGAAASGSRTVSLTLTVK